MLPNEAFALACRAYYDEMGLIVDERNGEFAHCPYPRGMGETGYYLLNGHHQHQGILQSRDVGRCCFFSGDAKRWLLSCDYWPDNYFELWDIYESYAQLNGKRCAEIVHSERDEFGRSLAGIKAAERLHSKKDEAGKSLSSMKGGLAGVANQTGIHNPEYRQSEEYKAINKLAGERGGTEGKRRKSGIHNPEYRASAEYRNMRSSESKKLVERKVGIFDPEFKKKQNEDASKPVVFHYPDGTTASFPSRMEAIRQTKISSSTLVRVLRNGKAISTRRFKGVRITEA